MLLDQIKKQENIKVKGFAGATSIFERQVALIRWMIAGPEHCKILEAFEEFMDIGHNNLN